MTKRCCVFTVVILCTGTAASIGAFFVADHFSYALEQHYFKQKAEERVQALTSELRQRLSMVRGLGAQLTELSANSEAELRESEKRFGFLAESIRGNRHIASVEWAPHVRWQDRAQFEELMQSVYENKQLRITQLGAAGQKVPLGKKRQMIFPSLFVSPTTRLPRARLLHRYVPQPRSREPSIVIGRKFYPRQGPKQGPRSGAFYTLRGKDSSGQENITGLLTVTFRGALFGISRASGDAQPVRVRIKDVTFPARSPNVGNEFPQQTANAVTSDDVPTRLDTIEHSIGGHKFRFDCQPNPNYDFRPTWLPWTAFISGLALTALCACGWTFRDNRKLERRVANLNQEVDERKEMQRFLQTVLEFREQERELVAHEIHDGFVQEVVGAQMFVQAIAARVSKDDHSSQRDLAMTVQLLSKAIEEGRRMISDLKPSVVDEMGLLEAIKQLVSDEEDHFGLSITFRHSANLRRLPPLVERTLYRIIQESVTNVKRHSGAFEATVSLIQTDRSVVLEVKDLGRGFDITEVEDGRFGVRGIQERARLLHGHATISSAPQQGTCVTVEIPLESLGISSTPHSQRRLTAPASDQSSRAATSS